MRAIIVFLCVLLLAGCQSAQVKTQSVSPLTQLRAGEEAYRSGDLQQAKRAFHSVIKVDHHNEESHFRLANIAYKEGDLAKAREHYEAVLGVNPRHAKAHHNLALVYLMQSELHLSYFVANSGASPQHSRIYKLLGAIDEFSNEPATPADSLDALARSLANTGTPIE